MAGAASIAEICLKLSVRGVMQVSGSEKFGRLADWLCKKAKKDHLVRDNTLHPAPLL